MHSHSTIKSTQEIMDPYSNQPYIYFDNPNHKPSPKSGTSIVILRPDIIKNPTLIYNDSEDSDRWQHPTDDTASSGRIQIITFEYNGQKHFLANIYAPSENTRTVKVSFFRHLTELFSRPFLSNLSTCPLILAGDWNLVEDPSKDTYSIQSNGTDTDNTHSTHPECISTMTDFLDSLTVIDPALPDTDEIDITDSPRFNAFTFRHRNGKYWAALDRFYVNPKAFTRVQYTLAPTLSISDHSPIKLIIHPTDDHIPNLQYGNDLYRIQTSIIGVPKMKLKVDRLIKAALLKARYSQNRTLPYTEMWETLKSTIYNLYAQESKYLLRKMREEENHLNKILNPLTNSTPEEIQIAKDHYNQLVEDRLLENRAAHCAFKFMLDEKGTREFFQRQTFKRKKKSAITELLIDTTLPPDIAHAPNNIIKWNDDPESVKTKMNSYWSHILRKRMSDNDPDVMNAQDTIIDTLKTYLDTNNLTLNFPGDNYILEANITSDEIKASIDSTSLGKSPGKDGIPIEFYVIHTNSNDSTINSDSLLTLLSHVYSESYDNDQLPKSQCENIVTLLYKKVSNEDRRYPKNYRPITLQNLDYKILYKLLANRLKQLIGKIIPHFQHAYVPGRCISDALLLTKSIINDLNVTKRDAAILSLDYEKAFDSVDHTFTCKVMEAFGIPGSFIKWVKMAFQSSQMQLTINGFLTDPFPMSGGGKQGDPLYPYIFIMVMAAVAAQIESDPLIEGITPSFHPKAIKTLQFADDSPYFINSTNDYNRIIAHLDVFDKAAGTVRNLDKSALHLFGKHWPTNPPASFSDSPLKLYNPNNPMLTLGMHIGPTEASTKNWNSVLSKARRAAAAYNCNGTLTLNGKIILANACITSISIYTCTHSYVSHAQLKALKSIINQFTNPENQTVSYIPYAEKIKPHHLGGPLTTLLDPYTLCPAQAAKLIYQITLQFNPNMNVISWIHDWVHILSRVGKKYNIYHIDHILMCDLPISDIRSDSSYDPHVLSALRFFNKMQFTRKPDYMCYEECATLPIWYNPLIKDNNNQPFQFTKPPFSVIKKRTLTQVGQLFDNFNTLAYLDNASIPQGSFYSNDTLNAMFSPHHPITDAHWDSLKAAVRNSPLFLACTQGTIPLREGQFAATLSSQNNTDQLVDVYSITTQGRLQWWDRHPDNPYQLQCSVHPPGIPGQGGYPHISDLYRIHTHNTSCNTYTVGLAYKHIAAHDNHMSWHNECFFGIRQGLYISPFGLPAAEFSSISKNFRHNHCFVNNSLTLTTHESSHYFSHICALHPGVDWHKQFQTLNANSSSPRCKNVIWRIITDNLFLGERAAQYLQQRRRPELSDSYLRCPYCSAPSSLPHQFWECPCVKPFWQLVNSTLSQHGLATINCFTDIHSFFAITNKSDITSLFRNDLIYNAIFTIWYNYNSLMRHITNDTLTDHELQEWINTIQSQYIHKFNSLNHESYLLLPSYVRHIIYLRTGVTCTRERLAQPPTTIVIDTFTTEVNNAYTITWCKCDILGTFVLTKPVFKTLPTLPNEPTLSR